MLGRKAADRGNDRSAGGAPAAGGASSMSIIGPGMNIVGDLSTDGKVRVEGRIQGTIRAGKEVIIGKGGEVHGDIVTDQAVVGGVVRGSISAENRLELQASCDIEGMIRAKVQHLHMEEGARFNGQVQMLDGSSAEPLALPAFSGAGVRDDGELFAEAGAENSTARF